MTDEMKKAFESWWKADKEDGPDESVTKKRAREIFMAGYAHGSRKPVYQMNVTQYQALVKMIRASIEDKK